jgi:two-component system, NtrC family, response regulator HupR/HoxA
MATAPTDLAELAGGAAVDYRAHPILVVDDEPEILHTFQFNYRNDFSILVAGDAESALAVLQSTDVAVVVADHRMPGRSGVELLADARRLRPDALRIILTGYTDMETLVRGVNEGAIYRYVTKPWNSAELRVILRRAIETFATTRRRRVVAEQLEHEKERLEAENRYLRQREQTGLRAIVGDGEAMRRVFTLIERVRDVPTPVLIEGETGTGKELVARAIHFGGAYRERLFVAQNCGALTESLLESELFGHRRGAFTGATSDKKGLFELAHEGTLFLDEVSETSPAFQVKLLRVLEDNEIRPLGDGRPRRVRVRIIAATNRRLADEVQAGRFRADLYYRLAVFPIAIPPLRDRREDIAALAHHFVTQHGPRLGRKVSALSPGALALLGRYDYPGNVRELENEIERAVLLCPEGEDIGEELLSERVVRATTAARDGGGTLAELVADFERARIVEMLAACGGNKSEAARRFGLTYRGLLAKMQRLGCA